MISTERHFAFPRRQQRPVVFGGGGGGGGSSGSEACPCTCIEDGNMVLHGVETTSKWSVRMGSESFAQAHGEILFPGGLYTLTWSSGAGKWRLDIGDSLTARYASGADATAATTMDGTLEMEWDGYASPMVKLCVDGTVPEEPSA